MKLGIYYYKTVPESQKMALTLSEALKSDGFEVTTITSVNAIKGVDVLVVLGGDGTMLSAAIACGQRGIRIVGVNYGHLGFLTEFECGEWREVIHFLSSGALKTDKRSAMKISLDNKDFYALNEVVIQRRHDDTVHRQIIALRAEIDGKLLDRYAADGLIVCTPTGSTAYALSAGGAILSPDMDAFMATPICAHTLKSRPIVYNDKRELTISLSSGYTADVYCDGKRAGTMTDQTQLTVTKADFTVDFLTREEKNFYDKLFYKMSQWGGGTEL